MLTCSYITDLNRNADESTTYKLIYIARHGEGYHNQARLSTFSRSRRVALLLISHVQAESHYGTPAWNCYWSLQTTDGNITWVRDIPQI